MSDCPDSACFYIHHPTGHPHVTPPCHCGRPVAYGFDGDSSHHRGMCEHCDSVRCDAYPGECRR